MATKSALMTAAWVSTNILGWLLMFWMVERLRRAQAAHREERKLREELDAYAELEAIEGQRGSDRELAARVCTAIAECSAFRQVAMLMRDAENRLRVVGSAGVNELMALEINGCVARFMRERRREAALAERPRSFPVLLEWDAVQVAKRRGRRQVMILPLWSRAGEMLGALAVWPTADGPGAMRETLREGAPKRKMSERVLLPLEALAQKLARAVDFVQMDQRLARAEKMAGLGQAAKGVAHELNNPLTAVLGFAELIVASTNEQRVREDAVAIAGQAMRMRETIASLLRGGCPAAPPDVTVDLGEMLHGLVKTVEPRMKQHGVQLELHVEGEACCVRGDEDRLRKLFEHLLDNAMEAVAGRSEEVRTVRVAVTGTEPLLRVVVTDSGAGFVEAARVFEPFYTMKQTGRGQGSGLAVSYNIVREHGGDISAFNVHPHGAAVVVELPVARTVVDMAELQGRPIVSEPGLASVSQVVFAESLRQHSRLIPGADLL